MPRGPGQTPGVFFERPEWNAGGGYFAADIRAAIDTIDTWQTSVRAAVREPARLSFHGVSEVPSHYDIYLLDDAQAKSVDLRKNPAYMFTPATPVTQFRIAVGTREAIQEALTDLMPKDFALHQNFPNPFNPTTTIRYSVGELGSRQQAAGKRVVRLAVYDLLGREVAVLVNEPKEPGIYYVPFDARRLASGMYICRMTAGEFQAVRKMMLLR